MELNLIQGMSICHFMSTVDVHKNDVYVTNSHSN